MVWWKHNLYIVVPKERDLSAPFLLFQGCASSKRAKNKIICQKNEILVSLFLFVKTTIKVGLF